MKKLFVIGLFILFNIGLHAQNKQISLEDIWKNYAFYPSYVNGGRGMNDGEHYTVIERDENRNLQIVKYSYKNPQDRTVVFSSADVKINEKPLYFSDY